MASKKAVKSSNKIQFFDFSSWNFIIFLLLGFVLIVVVATQLQNGAIDLGVRAGFVCPNVKLKDPSLCPSGWKVDFKSGRCPVLVCPVSVVAPTPTSGAMEYRVPESLRK